ncbi:MAG: cation diffusion facilitator family transporter [Anaerolineae bacterium]|nr:cation diffusion facilitator family transporter [Anaerolineae bacterium]
MNIQPESGQTGTASKQEHSQTRAIAAVNLSLIANILLAAIKTSIGIIGHSPALLADGVNSTVDVAYGVVVFIFMGLSGKPADEHHPFGHNQLESVAALVIGSFVMTTAVAIFWESVNGVYDLLTGNSTFGGASLGAFWVALLTICLKLLLTIITTHIGAKSRNAAIQALAFDHRNDIFTALAAAIGIFFGRAGYPWVDPLAGAIVAIIILRTAISILRDSTSDLMDTLPGTTLSEQIETIVSTIPGVLCLEECRAHRFGPYLVAHITICVNGSLTIAEGDHIASEVERILINNIEYMHSVYVHIHPGLD